MLLKSVFAFVFSLSAVPLALAQDSGSPHGAEPQWSGLYIGAQVGAQLGNGDQSYNSIALVGDYDVDGVSGGIHLGLNHSVENWVVGIETDLEATNGQGSYANLTLPTAQGSTNMDWQGSLRARLGRVIDNVLVYGTVGWAYGEVDIKAGSAVAPLTNGFSADVSGWTGGGGIEWVISQDISARFEYRYTEFDNVSGALAPSLGFITATAGLDSHAVRFGISKKFGLPGSN